MTMTVILRRVAVLAAAILLATAIGAKPLSAANDDSAPKADDGSKKTEKKAGKKTTKTHAKSKTTTGDTATGTGQNPGYRPEPDHGSGY